MKKFLAALAVVAVGFGTSAYAATYDLGTIDSDPTTIINTVGNGYFFDSITFETLIDGTGKGSASNIYLELSNVVVTNISSLWVDIWDDEHPNGTTLYSGFAGDGSTYTFDLPFAGVYHADISGYGVGTGTTSGAYGSYAFSISVPVPATLALLGLGLLGLGGVRRRAA